MTARSIATNRIQIRNQPYTLLFTGASGNYVDLPLTFDPTATDFSITMWVRPTQLAARGTLTSHVYYSQNDGAGTGRTWMGMARQPDNSQFESFFGGVDQVSTYVMVANQFQHIVLTKTGTNSLSYYANGVSAGTSAPSIDSATGQHRLGASKAGLANMYGYLGPTKIYTRQLTSDEILADYLTGVISNSSNLQAYYPFSDGSGTTLTDISGNSNHGTIVGSAVTWSTLTAMRDRSIATGRSLASGRSLA